MSRVAALFNQAQSYYGHELAERMGAGPPLSRNLVLRRSEEDQQEAS